MGKRPQQDSAHKELAETKRENHTLKRQLSKLQKKIIKLLQEGPPSMPDEELVAPLEITGAECPDCQEALSVVSLGIKTLKVCKACKWRKVEQ